MPIKRLENLLNPAQDMGALLQCLQQQLPEESAANILSANVRDNGELVILASSPAWAAKLRFEADTLIAAARQSGSDVSSCKVRVSRNG
jgi:hypothetical protein